MQDGVIGINGGQSDVCAVKYLQHSDHEAGDDWVQTLGSGDWFAIVGGVVSIIAFVFSVLIWFKAELRERELSGVIQSIYDVSGNIIWEMQALPGEDDATRLRQAERAVGLASALHSLASKYARESRSLRPAELGLLIERGIILSHNLLWDIEGSSETKEVWLVSPDLEPDLSDLAVGKSVNRNLKAGTRYVYFYSSDLQNIEETKLRLKVNLGISKNVKLLSQVTFVRIDPAVHSNVFQRGNSILFFRGHPTEVAAHAYEEVVFTKLSKRGFFWQEHAVTVAQELQKILEKELRRQTSSP